MEIAASITSGELWRLAEMAAIAERGRADRIHLDVEDGVFIPTFTVGPAVVAGICRATRLPVEVHLQTMDPERWIPVAAAGRPARMIVHLEAGGHAVRMLRRIRDLGAAAGVALLLATPPDVAPAVLELVDQVTLLSSDPAPGSPFDPAVLDKVRALHGRVAQIEVDGGVIPQIMPQLARAGVTAAVAGRAVFGRGPDGAAGGIAALRAAIAG